MLIDDLLYVHVHQQFGHLAQQILAEVAVDVVVVHDFVDAVVVVVSEVAEQQFAVGHHRHLSVKEQLLFVEDRHWRTVADWDAIVLRFVRLVVVRHDWSSNRTSRSVDGFLRCGFFRVAMVFCDNTA